MSPSIPQTLLARSREALNGKETVFSVASFYFRALSTVARSSAFASSRFAAQPIVALVLASVWAVTVLGRADASGLEGATRLGAVPLDADEVVLEVHRFNAALSNLMRSMNAQLAGVSARGGVIMIEVHGKQVELVVAPGGRIERARSTSIEVRPLSDQDAVLDDEQIVQTDSNVLKSMRVVDGWSPGGKFVVRQLQAASSVVTVQSAEPTANDLSAFKRGAKSVEQCQQDCNSDYDMDVATCDWGYDNDLVWADAILIGGPSVCLTVTGAALEVANPLSFTPQARATAIAFGGTCSVGAVAVGLALRLSAADERFVCKAQAAAKRAWCMQRC